MPCLSHPPSFDHCNNIWWRVKIMNFLLMHFSATSCHFLYLVQIFSCSQTPSSSCISLPSPVTSSFLSRYSHVLKHSVYVLPIGWETSCHTHKKTFLDRRWEYEIFLPEFILPLILNIVTFLYGHWATFYYN